MRNGADALTGGAGGADRFDLDCVIGCGPTKSRPLGLCPCQPGYDTFPDHRAFKFGEYSEHLKQRATGRRGEPSPC